MDTNQLWLNEEQVIKLTKKIRPHAQLKQLKSLGYSVDYRLDGSFVVPVNQFLSTDSEKPTKEFQLDFSALGNGQAA